MLQALCGATQGYYSCFFPSMRMHNVCVDVESAPHHADRVQRNGMQAWRSRNGETRDEMRWRVGKTGTSAAVITSSDSCLGYNRQRRCLTSWRTYISIQASLHTTRTMTTTLLQYLILVVTGMSGLHTCPHVRLGETRSGTNF